MTRCRWQIPAAMWIAAALSVCSVHAQQKADVERAYNDVLAAGDDEPFKEALKKYKAMLPRVGNDYVYEGDLLRTDRELENDFVFVRARGAQIQQQVGPELTISLT